MSCEHLSESAGRLRHPPGLCTCKPSQQQGSVKRGPSSFSHILGCMCDVYVCAPHAGALCAEFRAGIGSFLPLLCLIHFKQGLPLKSDPGHSAGLLRQQAWDLPAPRPQCLLQACQGFKLRLCACGSMSLPPRQLSSLFQRYPSNTVVWHAGLTAAPGSGAAKESALTHHPQPSEERTTKTRGLETWV